VTRIEHRGDNLCVGLGVCLELQPARAWRNGPAALLCVPVLTVSRCDRIRVAAPLT
jgi:hypothetical protein